MNFQELMEVQEFNFLIVSPVDFSFPYRLFQLKMFYPIDLKARVGEFFQFAEFF
jgi:hypothetical protein